MSMIMTVFFTAALAAQQNDTPPPPKAAAQSAPKAHGKAAKKDASPDADLIGFLGDYEDAADGLDPIGLSEQIAVDPTAAKGDTKKDGHEP
jgi:hypothetical protein